MLAQLEKSGGYAAGAEPAAFTNAAVWGRTGMTSLAAPSGSMVYSANTLVAK